MKLPVDDILPGIVASLRGFPNLVIEAPPGAGKTTRVPPRLLNLTEKSIVVLEPRRIAARLAARRVAAELGEKPGETIGYQVRFEDVSGPRTRIRYVTEGVLTRKLLSDPGLRDVGVVVLDEFHERHLDGDLALMLLRRLQASTRPDLKLIVMSATLDSGPVSKFLGDCPVLRSEGRLFPLAISHETGTVEQAVERLLTDRHVGDILVFLPGAAEIRQAARACERLVRPFNLLVLPLHGDLTPAEQDRAVGPSPQRKVILSTNVAESSVTIEGVTAVIDTGLARIASDSPWTGLPTLQVSRISKASATQRAGRAARTAPGRVIRLYTAEDFHRRPEHDTPEILRRELTQVCLDLHVLGVDDPLKLEWLDAPPQSAIVTAERLLDRLRVRGDRPLPLHPRLAKLVLEAVSRGVGEDGCRVAALLSSGARVDSIDADLDPRSRQHYDQIRRAVRPPKQIRRDLDPLLLSILTAFPDRVGKRRRDNQAMLANGVGAILADPLHTSEYFVALDIEDRSENAAPLIRLTSQTQVAWLVDLFPDIVSERNSVEWNRTAERVEAVSALVYDELVIEESRGGMPDAEFAAEMLSEKALEAGLERFVDAEEFTELMARIEFASAHGPIQIPDVAEVLREMCQGLRSFAELKSLASTSLLPALEQRVNATALERIAPARIKLPSGRQTRVRYDSGKPPWIASRLQDFFGARETPRIAGGAVPLVVHLLAPNQRPVQTTTDLGGFWKRLYPQIRNELSRRYPKHAWPENPTSS